MDWQKWGFRRIVEGNREAVREKEDGQNQDFENALEKDEAKEIASRIAEQTEACLVEVRGHTFILYKRRKK